MSYEFRLSGFEISALLSWYDYVRSNTVALGGFDPLQPLEQGLVDKLVYHQNEAITFSLTEIEILCGWMRKVVYGKYGSDEHLFGYERRAYIKLKTQEWVMVR